MTPLPDGQLARLRDLVARLAVTWNEADGAAFGALFAQDAVFVDIKANRDDGRAQIAERHVRLFETVFRGTHVAYHLVDAAAVAPGLALGHVRAHVSGAGMAVETQASVLFRQDGEAGWLILMFHNTEIGRY